MKGIYRFHWNCGRMGDLYGVFTADSDDVENAMGHHVYFGEVLGKHSDIEGTIDQDDIQLVSNSPEAVATFDELGLRSGINPLSYIDSDEDEEDDDE